MMKHTLISLTLAVLMAGPASAECFADYKAKRDDPLRLHYGVIELPESVCQSEEAVAKLISQRIDADDWVLLNVLSVFTQPGLEQRKESAGEFYLRY